jgi:hypothetical protein
MNATSSRAHTVVTVTFDQISKNDSGQETKKSSTINLVDLAGRVRVQYASEFEIDSTKYLPPKLNKHWVILQLNKILKREKFGKKISQLERAS